MSTGQLVLGVVLLGVVFLVTAPFILAGLSLVYDGFVAMRQLTRAVRSEILDPADVPAAGHATVTGRARSGPSGRVEAPLTGRSGLGYRLRVQQKGEDGGWWTVVDTVDVGALELVGETGRVVVDPGEYEPDIELDRTVTAGPGDRLPDGAPDRIRRVSPDRTDSESLLPGAVERPRRYNEGVLEAGTTLYAHGACSAGSTGTTRVEAADSGEFRLGPESPADGASEPGSGRKTAVKKLFAGVILTVLGGFGLVMFGWIPVSMIVGAL